MQLYLLTPWQTEMAQTILRNAKLTDHFDAVALKPFNVKSCVIFIAI